jgi:uncharacterized glyoxalase superfamily protein PhnB
MTAKPELRSAAPVFQVADVGATMRWYETNLGFKLHPFPANPPHVFCVMGRDRVEIMLQRVGDQAPLDVYRRRAGGVWHVYLRMENVAALFEDLRANAAVEIVEPLHKQPYGDTEFVVRDPNGYLLVFSG